jgi:hypothetical protein
MSVLVVQVLIICGLVAALGWWIHDSGHASGYIVSLGPVFGLVVANLMLGTITFLALLVIETTYESLEIRFTYPLALIDLCIAIAGSIGGFFFMIGLYATGYSFFLPGVLVGVIGIAFLLRNDVDLFLKVATSIGVLLLCWVFIAGVLQMEKKISRLLNLIELAQGPLPRVVVTAVPLALSVFVYLSFERRRKRQLRSTHGSKAVR